MFLLHPTTFLCKCGCLISLQIVFAQIADCQKHFVNMAFIEEFENNSVKISAWIEHCEKTLDFVYNFEPRQLSVLEALEGKPNIKICDPYGYISEVPLCTKVESIENEHGKPVNKTDNISGNLTLKLTTGEEISGRWVEGKREGSGFIQGPRLEKVSCT